MSAHPATMEAPEPIRIALFGAPNSGKTTLFNALTGARARVGNFPGVTVQRREGRLEIDGRQIVLLDLPGTYTLEPECEAEAIVHDVLTGQLPGESKPDALLLIVDATTLPRSLGLVAQALHLKIPKLLVLTMIDEAKARGHRLDVMKLSRILGMPVTGVVGHRGVGVDQLRQAMIHPERWERPHELPPVADPMERFAWVDRVAKEVASRRDGVDARTERLDRVLLHPVGGLAIFAGVMAGIFQAIFTLAVPLMDGIDGFLNWFGQLSTRFLPSGILTGFWTDGVLAGVGAVLVFLPQIFILFALIHFLEDVGYMARAAFVVDRVMGWIGLQGGSFVPLLSCYACAVPGILAARTIPSPRERLSTILVSPFMPCSARLPVYTLLIAAFVPARQVGGVLSLQALTMLGVYALGTLIAFASAGLFNRTLLRGTPSRFYMELPPYRMPTMRLLRTQVWGSGKAFLVRAGTIILTVSLVFWVFLTFPRADVQPGLKATQQAQFQIEHSVAGTLGKAVEPLIAPLGFDWRIGVGLVTSLAAREVIVATLAQIYAVSDADFNGLRKALRKDPHFSLPTALSLLVFFMLALQCTSTIAVMGRETGSWRWPALAFGYMLVLAYSGSFLTYTVSRSLL